jgi:integrase
MLIGGISTHQFDAQHLQLIVTGWKARLAHNTVFNYSRVLRNLAKYIGMATDRPNLHTFMPHVGHRIVRKTIASPEEIAALLARASGWLRAAILLAAHAGFRRGDVLCIAPRHFDHQRQTITITQQKTKREVTVPASAELVAIFDTLANENPATPILELLRGRPVNAYTLNNVWSDHKRKCKVNPDLWFHDLRRTLAVSLYEISKDLRVVEQMLGHQSLAATVQYLEHRDPAKLKPYLDSLATLRTRRIQ